MAEALLLLLLSLPLAVVLHHLYYGLRFRLPPGPLPWPVVGNLYQMKPVRFRCFAEWAETYGPIISVWLGSSLNVVVSNSELAKEVLKEKDGQLADRHRSRSATTLSRDGQDLIWADYGPHYVKVRKFCTVVLFSPKRLESLRPIREDEVTAMVESIYNDCIVSNKNLVMIKKYLAAMSFNNTTRVAFGKRFTNSEGEVDKQGEEFKAISANGHKLGASLTLTEHVSWLRWADPLDKEAFTRHGARMERLARDLMQEHTVLRKMTGSTKQHFFDALLTLRDEFDLTEDNIIALLWDMMAAGMDTPAIAVEWAMAELVRHPRVQQKVQEELDRVVGHERVMTELDIPNLPYLRCVVKEALRLHPPTPLMLPHRASSNVKVGGYDIPKGTIVHVSAWALGRDPAVWKNPLEFRPERFLEEDVDIKGHDFRFLPFGSGRRVCPGTQLGIDLTTSLIGHLLHHFKWGMPQGAKAEEMDLGEKPGTVTVTGFSDDQKFFAPVRHRIPSTRSALTLTDTLLALQVYEAHDLYTRSKFTRSGIKHEQQ